jgi:predicted metal-dependent phosphoesterase TrpH
MIDLHSHTTCSDGTDTPKALINAALINGLTTIGVTDHDSIAGWNEAISALRGDLKLVLGAEISCLTKAGISVHMLGLLFDGDSADMRAMLNQTRNDRVPRMIKMADVDAVKQPGATLGRPHLADALVARGHIVSRDSAFQGLLNNESEFYVAHMAPTPEVAIAQIRDAGGVAVIAHPFASHRGETLTGDDFSSLVLAGLNGIEIDHRDQNSQERGMLRTIADDLGLVVTGSSDYHGSGKLNTLGENSTDPSEWARLEAMANERRVVTS